MIIGSDSVYHHISPLEIHHDHKPAQSNEVKKGLPVGTAKTIL